MNTAEKVKIAVKCHFVNVDESVMCVECPYFKNSEGYVVGYDECRSAFVKDILSLADKAMEEEASE